jgi:hypothetical protein
MYWRTVSFGRAERRSMVMLAKRTSCSTALRKAKLDLLPVQRDAELRIFAFDPRLAALSPFDWCVRGAAAR